MTPLAAAMAETVAATPHRRVRLAALLAAAAAVDRTGAVSVSWRDRVAAAIHELANAGVIELPSTRWDTTTEPRLPEYVTKPAAVAAATTRTQIVWHAELGWAAELDATAQLNPTDRKLLAHVNAWLGRRSDTIVPQRERSLDIFGDEKTLDTIIFTSLFSPGRLSHEMLRFQPCWPPVHQEILGPGPWLVVENWTTFRTLAAAARRCTWDGRLIWGAGNQVGTRLSSLAATGDSPNGGLWYFGDIDTAGFRIARMAAGRAATLGLGELRAARELYQACLDNGTPQATPHKTAEELQQWTLEWLDGPLGQKIADIVASGMRVVQETVGVELLTTIDPATLFGAR